MFAFTGIRHGPRTRIRTKFVGEMLCEAKGLSDFVTFGLISVGQREVKFDKFEHLFSLIEASHFQDFLL